MNRSGNKVLFVLFGLVIVLLVGILFLNDRFVVLINDINKDDEKNSYDVFDYIDIEKVDFGFDTNKLDIDKIIFKNIDVSVVNDFIDEQNSLINMVRNNYNYWLSFNFEGLSSKDGLVASSDIWYQINGNIMSVYYKIHSEDAIGECDSIAVINIDLDNKSLVTNEKLLELGGISFNYIAEESYNKTLDIVKNCNKEDSFCGVLDKDYNLIKVDEFISNKNNYIKKIEDGLDGAIDCYIKDGKIKYDYRSVAIDVLYLGVGKGGCFDYLTVEVGDYK